MIITLYGPDSYRRLKKLNEILDNYRGKYTGLSHERFDMLADDALDKFKNFASTQSMFDPVRLVILDNTLEAEDQKELRAILKAKTEDKELIIVINSAKKPPAAYKFALEKPSTSQEFLTLKGEKLLAFIKQISDEHKLKIDVQRARLLANTYGSDTWGLVTELEQMALGRKHVSKDKPNEDYFGLTNVIKRGAGVRERLVALEIILSDRKDDPARVFNSIAYRPTSASDARRLADYDIAIKSGKLEYEEVLLSLALDA